LAKHEFRNVSNAHIKAFDGIIKAPPEPKRKTMITLLLGLVASSMYAWWHRRQSASKQA
jgi:hypothetical protein